MVQMKGIREEGAKRKVKGRDRIVAYIPTDSIPLNRVYSPTKLKRSPRKWLSLRSLKKLGPFLVKSRV